MKAADRVFTEILERIVNGTYPVGEDLPGENALASDLRVSRLTVRESTRALASQGVIATHQGRRNRVAPTHEWSVLDPVIVSALVRLDTDASSALLADLLETRRMLEVPLARLAATRITDAQLDALGETITVMDGTSTDPSPAGLAAHVDADMTFHQVILDAAGNGFVRSVFSTMAPLLHAVRLQTSASEAVRVDALAHHRAIRDALARRDPDAAARAMGAHMDQTLRSHAGVNLSGHGPLHPGGPPTPDSALPSEPPLSDSPQPGRPPLPDSAHPRRPSLPHSVHPGPSLPNPAHPGGPSLPGPPHLGGLSLPDSAE